MASLTAPAAGATSKLEAPPSDEAIDYRQLFESVPGLFLVLKPDAPRYTIVAASEAYLRATLTERASIIGRAMFEVFPDNPDDPDSHGVARLSSSLDRVVASKAPDTMAIQKYDVRSDLRSGVFVERWWSPVNSPVLGADGEIRYIIHRVEDVTDYVRLQASRDSLDAELAERTRIAESEIMRRSQELDAANAQLRRQSQERELFLAMMGHEIRNPLTSLRAAEHLLARHAGNAALMEEARALIGRQVEAIARLAGDLVDVARARNGELKLMRETFDLGELARSVLHDYQKTGRLHGHAVSAEIEAAEVLADPRRIEQVLLNLLDNAVKYTPPGNQIVLAVRPADGYATVRVKDEGVGMRAEVLARAFDWFYQADDVLDRAQGGFGIGLALVRKIVELNGGTVVARSNGEGKGTEIEVSLPLALALRGARPKD